MPGCNWSLAQDSPLVLGIQGILSRFQKTPLSSLSPALSTPQTLWAFAPTPAMAPGAPSSSPSPILAALLFSSLVLSPALAIVVYTDREVYGAVGSQVTLHCSFWSSEWVSDDISFTWRYQPEGGRDAISIFHYAKGQPYIDEVGTFKERIQWVGDPRWKDGSIVIHNLDYSDNGTFTCDVKNPPDIVGKTSQVTLYVFEKVPTRYGVVLGAVIGGILGVVLLLLLLFYLIRYCWLRRQAALQRRLSAMEKGRFHKSSKDSSKRGRQTPVLYAMLDHSRSTKAASEKKSKGLGESRKDKK
ncbi:myelin protein P0 [Mastomys coucha]|uniref:myelin protein P0 n=1 Tax=Mastomys coucha TaxID=35658 RepID=UPI0012621876|nr:myelin protein P0 [Mastomys coucha]